jgi:hypothetical protein
MSRAAATTAWPLDQKPRHIAGGSTVQGTRCDTGQPRQRPAPRNTERGRTAKIFGVSCRDSEPGELRQMIEAGVEIVEGAVEAMG